MIYLCDCTYIEYNFSLQLAIHLANHFSVPLIVILIRSADEYKFPFSHHTLSVFAHLSSFHSNLLSLHITPLLLFTSSLSNAITSIVNEMHPLFLLADHFSDLRLSTEFSQLATESPSISNLLLHINNAHAFLPSTPLSLHSPFLSADDFMSLSQAAFSSLSDLLTLLPTYRLPTTPLHASLQSKVAYSLQLEKSFLSRTDLSESIGFDSCVLILPPFLLLHHQQQQHSITPGNDSDFTYQTERRAMHVVANWGDIHHEIRYHHLQQFQSVPIEASLHCSDSIYPYIRNAVATSTLYRLTMQLACGFVSEYSLLEHCQCHLEDHQKELAQLLAVRSYYRFYFARHSSML